MARMKAEPPRRIDRNSAEDERDHEKRSASYKGVRVRAKDRGRAHVQKENAAAKGKDERRNSQEQQDANE